MRYETEVIINLPRDRVIELFDSFENLKEWQEGLISHDHVSGTAGRARRQDESGIYDGQPTDRNDRDDNGAKFAR